MKAIWIEDYDYHTDKLYKRPGCPECEEPVFLNDAGKYCCASCGKDVEVADPEMVEWLKVRHETKVEMKDCTKFELEGMVFGCGGKACVETHYYRNKVTLGWQVGWSVCRNCGAKTIV